MQELKFDKEDRNERKRNINLSFLKEDWSLHRKGHEDQQRHQEKVQEAIRNNLPDLITEESIIMSNGREVVKIPIRSLDEYKIRYNYDKNKHVGQGDGESKVGDVVAVMDLQVKKDQEKGKEQEINQEKIILKQKFH